MANRSHKIPLKSSNLDGFGNFESEIGFRDRGRDMPFVGEKILRNALQVRVNIRFLLLSFWIFWQGVHFHRHFLVVWELSCHEMGIGCKRSVGDVRNTTGIIRNF